MYHNIMFYILCILHTAGLEDEALVVGVGETSNMYIIYCNYILYYYNIIILYYYIIIIHYMIKCIISRIGNQ